MPRDIRLLSKWRVFVDGVEMPHIGIQTSFGRNQYGSVRISAEPDKLIHSFRPNANVLVFFRDPYAETPLSDSKYRDDDTPDSVEFLPEETTYGSGSADDLRLNYRLYFEGELTGYGHTKSPQARSMYISASGLFRILERHRAFQSSIGGVFTTPLLTGGYALPQMLLGEQDDESSGDILSMVALTDTFFTKDSAIGDKDDALAYRSSTVPSFSDRVISLIAFLASFNGSVRMSAVRTRLLNKIGGIPDATLTRLLKLTLTNKVLGEMQGKVDASASLLDIINMVCQKGFYSWFHQPGPHTPLFAIEIPNAETGELEDAEGQPLEPSPIPLPTPTVYTNDDEGQTRGLFSIIRDYCRNDYLFLPEMYYAPPPPCNFIFPEDMDGLQYDRVFDSEPTRFVMKEPFYSSEGAAYFAPSWILRKFPKDQRARINTSDFFSSQWGVLSGLMDASRAKYGSVSPYVSPAMTDNSSGGVNLLSVMSDEEIEKGIICSMTYHPYELFSTLARNLPADAEGEADESDEDSGLSGSGSSDYQTMMCELAQYRLMVEATQRNMSVALHGNPWIVPGFTAVVFDMDSSYIGFVESVNYTVDVFSGQERTSIALSHVRHIPYVPTEPVSSPKLNSAAERSKRMVAAATTAVSSFNEILGEAIAAYKSASAVLGKYPTLSAVPRDQKVVLDAAVDVLNRKATAIASSVYGASPSMASKRYLRARPNLPLYASACDLDYVEGAGGVKDYAVDHHLPVFPNGWQSSSVYNEASKSTIGIGASQPGSSALRSGVVRIQLNRLFEDIKDYIDFQKERVRADTKAGRALDIDDLGNSTIRSAITSSAPTADPESKAELARALGFFAPPSWFNQGFLKVSNLDAIYGGLLGCQPFYDIYSDGQSPHGRMNEDMIYREHIRMLQAMDKVFPLLDPAGPIPSARNEGELSVWAERSLGPELSPGPGPWFGMNVQRRDITTMDTFLKQHGLALYSVISDNPSPTVFYKMTPSIEGRRDNSSGSVAGYRFDNSLFSMVVDEWELFGKPGAEQAAKDPAVVEIKSQAEGSYLSREKRQEIVEAYSRRHFGSRAFDGR